MAARTDEAGAFRLDLPEQGEVDLVAKFPTPADAPAATSESTLESTLGGTVEGTPDPAILEFVASDAEGVVLRFER